MTRGSVRVRAAGLADVDLIVELADALDVPRGYASGRSLSTERAQFGSRFRDMLANPSRAILVAEDDSVGGVVGFVVVSDDELASINPTPVLTVSHLTVHPKARRRGIGRALMAAVVHLAEDRGVDHVVATANSGSRDANRYLARLGFAPLVIRRIAPTSVLRRSLGIADGPDRLALRRRLRTTRSAVASARSISRGA